jgi:hypothetical protein
MRGPGRLLVWAAAAAGCGRVVTPTTETDATVPVRHIGPARATSAPVRLGPGPDARPARPIAADQGPEEPDLQAEPRDRDPRSATVAIKLFVTPEATGTVVWGRKKLADLRPGQMSLQIERPRDSGPLDVLVRAAGFLPHHVRLFTDRDERLSVRLYRPDDARALLGYRRPPDPPP